MKKSSGPDEYRVVEAVAAEDGSGFDGYAATWWTVDTYGTAWKRGAFSRSISRRGTNIAVLWSHQPDFPIGKITAIEEDRKGLRFSASIVDATQKGAETMALLRAGVPLGMSFGFNTIQERPPTDSEWDKLVFAEDTDFYQTDEGKSYVRIKTETNLWEVSPVTFPANSHTSFTDVRQAVEADTLATITEQIRAGTLNERSIALVEDLVDAWESRPDPPDDHQALPLDRARRDREIAIALLQAQYQPLTGVQA